MTLRYANRRLSPSEVSSWSCISNIRELHVWDLTRSIKTQRTRERHDRISSCQPQVTRLGTSFPRRGKSHDASPGSLRSSPTVDRWTSNSRANSCGRHHRKGKFTIDTIQSLATWKAISCVLLLKTGCYPSTDFITSIRCRNSHVRCNYSRYKWYGFTFQWHGHTTSIKSGRRQQLGRKLIS